jgi:hypothetical protein
MSFQWGKDLWSTCQPSMMGMLQSCRRQTGRWVGWLPKPSSTLQQEEEHDKWRQKGGALYFALLGTWNERCFGKGGSDRGAKTTATPVVFCGRVSPPSS